MNKWTPRIAFFLALVVGHFIYQAFFGQAWLLAVERSIFQGVALFGWWIFEWKGPKSYEDAVDDEDTEVSR